MLEWCFKFPKFKHWVDHKHILNSLWPTGATKLLPEPILTYLQRYSVAFTWKTHVFYMVEEILSTIAMFSEVFFFIHFYTIFHYRLYCLIDIFYVLNAFALYLILYV